MSDPGMQELARRLVLPLKAWFVAHDVTPVGIGARVYNSAAITINNGVVTTVSFNSERYDTDNLHSTTTNPERLTITRPGIYLVWANIRFSDNAAGFRQMVLVLNGTTVIASDIRAPVATGFGYDMTLATIYQFAVNDYVTVRAYQNSGANLTLPSVSNFAPECAIHRLA